MTRYAYISQQILEDADGNLLGVNFGYDFHAEHEFGYAGRETAKSAFRLHRDTGTFEECRITEPDRVEFFEADDGRVCMVSGRFFDDSAFTDSQAREKFFDEHRDNVRWLSEHTEHFDAFWDDRSYMLFSKTDEGTRILGELYDFICAGDVAVSADFRPLFEDRGLSFAILGRLNEDDVSIRDEAAYLTQLMRDGEIELSAWLEEHGNPRVAFHECETALWLSNVQASTLTERDDGNFDIFFYHELFDMVEFRRNLDGGYDNISAANIGFGFPLFATGDDLKALWETCCSEDGQAHLESIDDRTERASEIWRMWCEALGREPLARAKG